MAKEQLPAIRYETFIDAFQRAVAAKQKEIEQLESGQREYLACAAAIRRVALPNDGELKLVSHGAHITITALPTDSKATFDAVVDEIGKELKALDLHRDGQPSLMMSTCWYPEIRYSFRTTKTDYPGSVLVEVKVPREGLRDLEVIIEERPTMNTYYKLEPRE